MDVLPLHRDRRSRPRPATSRTGTAEVTGTYRSADGRLLRFTGSYRLERLLRQFEEPAAAGVFSGRVVEACDGGAGVASRRQTTAVRVLDLNGLPRLELGPVDVQLLGVTVAVETFTVDVPLWLLVPVPAEADARDRPLPGLRLVGTDDRRV